MLTILVGDVKPEIEADFHPDYRKAMPKEKVDFFWVWIQLSCDQTVRVYEPHIIESIGYRIAMGNFPKEGVVVITTAGEHTFNDDGVLSSNWPYGIFNWSN